MEFQDFSIDPAALELRKGGVRVDLSPQAVRLLAVLVRKRGELVTRQELYAALWPGEPEVDVDRGLNTLIRQIRQALGDSPTDPRFIRTYPRRGYRFLVVDSVPARLGEPEAASPAAAAPALAIRRRPSVVDTLLVVAVIFMAAVLVLGRDDPDSSVPRPARESFELGRHLLQSPAISRRGMAVPYFRETVRLAPTSARARAHLADALLWADRDAEAEREARRALELDAKEPHALFIGGVLALIQAWDWTRAETLLRRAVARDRSEPTYAVVLAFLLSTAGRHEEAVRLLDRARSLDPASAILTADIGMMYWYASQPRQAAEACEHAVRLAPEATYARDCALAARVALGDLASARAHAVALLALAGEDGVKVLGDLATPAASALARYRRWQADRARAAVARAPFGAALAFAEAGHVAEAISALGQAAANRDMGFVTITVDPRFAGLRADSAFLQLAAQLVARGAAAPRS